MTKYMVPLKVRILRRVRSLLPSWFLRRLYRARAWAEHVYREMHERGRPLWLYVNGTDWCVARSPWEARRLVMWDGGLDEDDVEDFSAAAPDRVLKLLDEDNPKAPPIPMSPFDIVSECGEPRYFWSSEWY